MQNTQLDEATNLPHPAVQIHAYVSIFLHAQQCIDWAAYHAQLNCMKDHQHDHSPAQYRLRYRQTSAHVHADQHCDEC